MTLRSRFFTLAVWLCAGGCHSANWSPPEPQQAPDPVRSPIVTPPIPSSSPEPSASVAPPAPPAPSASAPPAAVSSEPAAASSSEADADPKPKPAAKGSAKPPGPATAPADAYAGPDPCLAKTFHYSVIGGACKKAGRKPVKDIMRGVVKKAKAAGQDIQCTSCHVDTSTYLLKPNAVSDIKQWL